MSITRSRDRIDGPMALEFILGTNRFVEIFAEHVGTTPVSIKATGPKTRKEQELLGMARIEGMIYPFAVELALKALWNVLHDDSERPWGHKLKEIFDDLPNKALDKSDALLAKDQARKYWIRRRKQNSPTTLDEFLNLVNEDFVRIRYGDYSTLGNRNTHSYKLCLAAIVAQLVPRDPDTWSSVTVAQP